MNFFTAAAKDKAKQGDPLPKMHHWYDEPHQANSNNRKKMSIGESWKDRPLTNTGVLKNLLLPLPKVFLVVVKKVLIR